MDGSDIGILVGYISQWIEVAKTGGRSAYLCSHNAVLCNGIFGGKTCRAMALCQVEHLMSQWSDLWLWCRMMVGYGDGWR